MLPKTETGNLSRSTDLIQRQQISVVPPAVCQMLSWVLSHSGLDLFINWNYLPPPPNADAHLAPSLCKRMLLLSHGWLLGYLHPVIHMCHASV